VRGSRVFDVETDDAPGVGARADAARRAPVARAPVFGAVEGTVARSRARRGGARRARRGVDGYFWRYKATFARVSNRDDDDGDDDDDDGDAGDAMDDDARATAREGFLTALASDAAATSDASEARAVAAFARTAARSSRALEALALARVSLALEAKKRERDARAEACARRERATNEAQRRARADVGRFEAFVRENEVKRQSALRRAKEEREANEARDARLTEMRWSLRERASAGASVEEELGRVRVFEWFLARVAEEAARGNAFEDIADVLGRHDTLQRTYESLRASVVESNERVEATRAAHERAVKHMEEERLAATASVARLRQQDEDLKRENGRLQQEAAYRARAMVEKVRGLAEAKMAVRNLACRCSRDNRAYGGDASLSRELDFVEERARVLREIAHAATSDVA
jgi:hypothetical protein